MTDVRNPDDLVTAVVELQAKLADLESTLMYRVSRRPTGDIEPTVRVTPKPYTLLMKGQTLLRADYPVLVQFALDNGLFIPGGFSVLDGVTNFGMPDWQGKTIIGAGGAIAVGADIGADTKSITVANMPSHSHPVGGGTDDSGNHGGHGNGTIGPLAGGTGGSALLAPAQNSGTHWHGANALWTDLVGSGTPFDVRQSSKAVNWMIYT
jgi:microcystin-dependent protein